MVHNKVLEMSQNIQKTYQIMLVSYNTDHDKGKNTVFISTKFSGNQEHVIMNRAETVDSTYWCSVRWRTVQCSVCDGHSSTVDSSLTPSWWQQKICVTAAQCDAGLSLSCCNKHDKIMISWRQNNTQLFRNCSGSGWWLPTRHRRWC